MRREQPAASQSAIVRRRLTILAQVAAADRVAGHPRRWSAVAAAGLPMTAVPAAGRRA